MLVRGDGLAATMSRYLIDRIEAQPNIELWCRTEITQLTATPEGRLERIRWRHAPTGAETDRAIRNVFLFTGADPATEWLRDCGVGLDEMSRGTFRGLFWTACGEIAMQLCHDSRPFTDGAADPLDRARPCVAHGEHARHTRFEQEWSVQIAVFRGAGRPRLRGQAGTTAAKGDQIHPMWASFSTPVSDPADGRHRYRRAAPH
jgi:hypothetical protein